MSTPPDTLTADVVAHWLDGDVIPHRTSGSRDIGFKCTPDGLLNVILYDEHGDPLDEVTFALLPVHTPTARIEDQP